MSFFNQMRRIFLILLEFSWKWALQMFFKPEVVFLVYGQERHKRACWSVRQERRIGLLGLIGLLTVAMNGRKVKGLIVATTKSQEELQARPDLSLEVVAAVKQRFPWVKAIALAGQLPSWIQRSRPAEQLPEPCVGGTLGTLYTVINSVRRAAQLHFHQQLVTVAVVGGAGYTGSRVVELLSQQPLVRQVIALDPRYLGSSNSDKVVLTNDSRWLQEADLVVVLTAKGDDAREALANIRTGAVVLDDTHPMIGRELVGRIRRTAVAVYKVSTAVGEVSGSSRMRPQLPDFKPGDLPGCLVEAVVRVSTATAHISYEEFECEAAKLGMVARLGSHPKS